MVGHPKDIGDLAKIEAGVKVTCRRCKRERLLDRERLIRDLTRRGLSTAWDLLPGNLKCACGSKAVDIVAMPFTSGEEDGEALFERLLRAFERHNALGETGRTNGEWCRAVSDASKELHRAKVAMRAWIVARTKG
jgi:hypothetical protein